MQLITYAAGKEKDGPTGQPGPGLSPPPTLGTLSRPPGLKFICVTPATLRAYLKRGWGLGEEGAL